MHPVFLNKLGIYATRTLFGLLVVTTSIAWLMGTEPVLRWGAQQAERLSDGRLTLGTVHGSLYGPLRIEALGFQGDEYRIEVKEANLDWAPLSLLKRHVQINRLNLQELLIIETENTVPIVLPETLHLPITFSAPAIRIDQAMIKSGRTEYALSDIELGMDKHADHYKLNLRSIATEWGGGQAEIMLSDTRPFNTQAHISLQQAEGTAYRAEAEVSGNLTQLLLDAKANALGGQAEIHARLMPLEEFPLAEARIKADGMNSALLGKGLPEANLSAVVSITRQGPDGLEGNIVLRNELAGRWDQSRLPLREMTARFAGTLNHLDLRAVQLDLAEAGRFEGDGQIREQQLQLNLSTAGFNPQGVHSTMRPMRLAGDIRLHADPQSQQLAANLRYQRFRLHLDARHQDAVVELRQATVQSGGGSLNLHGTLGLEGLQQFQLAGTLRTFNPADFGNYPVARINASLSGNGQLAATPQGTLEFAISDSHFRHQPLSGQGKLSISAARIWNSDVSLRLARNRLEAKGALGNPDDRFTFQVEADNLSLLDPDLVGQIHARGTLAGRISAPSGSFDARFTRLSWRDLYRVTDLHIDGRLDQGVDGQLALNATLQGLASPQLHLDQASLNAQGTRTDHTLQILAKNPDIEMESQLAGGWHDASGWDGQVMKLVNRGRHGFALKSPAKLKVAGQHVLLGNARFDFAGANLALHELDYNAGQVASRGEFNGLPLAYLQGLAGQNADLQTDLTLGGEWQFAVRNTVDGHFALWHERGDVSVSNNPQITLGISRFALNVDAQNNRLKGRLEANGTNLGSLRAEAQSVLSVRDGAWGIAGDAPVQASVDLSVGVLSWMQPLLDQTGTSTFDGALTAQLRAGGTFSKPDLAGSVSGDRFTVAWPNQGLRFTEGRFQAELQGQALQLNDLAVRGGDGMLRGQGQIELGGSSPTMHIALQADKLEVFSRPDRHLILSGKGDVSVAGKDLRIAAKLKADQGLIELPDDEAPAPSDDVVVLGLTKAMEKKPRSHTLSANLDIDLGERFTVKGQGLDAQLGGTLKLTTVNGALPSSSGSIRVVKGAYSAYGQRLEIERGIFNFQGPVDNPSLNIVALRKNQPVEAGVAVTGTAQSPRVQLVSNPTVPDSEKLSWLVLGHGLEDSSNQEFNALQAAAGVLLATGESVTLQQKVAYAAGLEEVSLKGAGGLENTVLTLGKRLSSRAYLSYEQGLTGVGTLVKINYTLTKRLSARAQAGITPAVDLFYTFSFD